MADGDGEGGGYNYNDDDESSAVGATTTKVVAKMATAGGTDNQKVVQAYF